MWGLTLITDAWSLLAYSFCGCAVLLLIATIGKGWLRSYRERKRKNETHKWRGKGTAYWWPIWFAAMCAGILAIAASRPLPYPVAVYHQVVIHPQNEYGDWPMSAKEDSALVFHPCRDFDVRPMLTQAATEGWIADHVKWEQQPECQSIYDPSLGFTWNDPQFHYRRTTNARPTSQ